MLRQILMPLVALILFDLMALFVIGFNDLQWGDIKQISIMSCAIYVIVGYIEMLKVEHDSKEKK